MNQFEFKLTFYYSNLYNNNKIGVAYTLVVITTANVFIPLFLNLEVTSAYEVLKILFKFCVFIYSKN